MKKVKRILIIANIKAGIIGSTLACFLMPGNTATWLPIVNMITMIFIWLVLKANIKDF